MRAGHGRYVPQDDSFSSSDDEEMAANRGRIRGTRRLSPAGRRSNSLRGTPRSGSRSPRRSGSRSPQRRETELTLVHRVRKDLRNAMVDRRADLADVFRSFDRNADGFLTRQELDRGLQRLNIPLSAADSGRLMDVLDENRDGLVDWREFLKLVAPDRQRSVLSGPRRMLDRVSFSGVDDNEYGGQSGVDRLPRHRTLLETLLKAHCCCELVWVLLTLLVGFNTWAAMLVAWDGECPTPESCGNAANWFVGLGVWQPLVTLAGAAGLMARPMSSEPQIYHVAQTAFSGMYWFGCVTGLIVVVAQLVVVLGGTGGLLSDTDNIVPTSAGSTETATTCTVWLNYGAIGAVRSAGRDDRRVQELGNAATTVTGMCAGNTDLSEEPDIVCPAPSLPKQDYYEIAGRDVDSCCGCDVGIRDNPDGKCVLTADPDASQDNVCTAVMRYAECGDDSEIGACISNPDSCDHCAQQRPFPAFAHLAEVDSSRASSLCMSADRFGCTFMFKRTAEHATCIDDRCAGNTALGVEDVRCEAPESLLPNAESTRGRNASNCCHVTGMCIGNSDSVSEPDVLCAAPGEMRTGAEMIVGRDEATCCVTRGRCVGNTDGDAEPDVVCEPPSTLQPQAMMVAGRDEETCCHVTGMCIGNTDTAAEPDIQCPGVGHIKPDASLVSGRQYSDCCYVTGMCVGNSDLVGEPDVVCREFDERASLIDHAAETTGRDYDTCCHIAGFCYGNTNADYDVVCVAPSTAVDNAAAVRGSTSAACCHITGMCAGNTDPVAQPDVVCAAPSTLIDSPSTVHGRGDECCVCHDRPIAKAQCTLEQDQRPELDNQCTRVMLYAGCGSDETILACAADPTAADEATGGACSNCADPSFEAFYARAADRTGSGSAAARGFGGTVTSLSAQELCMEGELYACHYDFATFLEPCTARVETVGSGPSPSPTPNIQLLPAGAPAPSTGDDSTVVTNVAGGSGCTCEARSVARLMGDVDWDVGLSDAFVWFLFDFLLLSLLRAGGIYYVMNYSGLSLASLRLPEDRSDIM